MEFAIIDSNMTNPRKEEIIEIAQGYGYEYYSEMLYDEHCKKGKIPAEIEKMFYDAEGKKLVTKESMYHTLRKYGWLSTRNQKKVKIQKEDIEMCICCGVSGRHPTLHRLCWSCYAGNGPSNGNYDPHSEYSNGAAMYGMHSL